MSKVTPPANPLETAHAPSIWWWAFGYFAAYVPYAALTKVVTDGLVDTGDSRVSGTELLPTTVMAAVVTAFTFLFWTGWWRHAVPPGRRMPRPTKLTFISGLCASGIIATTTLAYTFDATIVFVMLLMRGGVLVLAPLIDMLSGRRIRWYSAAALALSIASLLTSVVSSSDPRIPLLCAVDIALYLVFYFVRLQIMTRKAKSTEPGANLRYFVQEQLVSSPALLVFLVIMALIGAGQFGEDLRAGFSTFFGRPTQVWMLAILIGVMSQGTGIFGGLILLDRRENTFSIPVNRASSVVAGVVASLLMFVVFDGRAPQESELAGAAIMVAAILVLSFGGLADRYRGPRPRFAHRMALAAAVSAAGAVLLSVVAISRTPATSGAARDDPFVLLLSPGHGSAETAQRLATALSLTSGLAVEVRRAATTEDAIDSAGTASVHGALLPLFEYLLVRQEHRVEAGLQVLRHCVDAPGTPSCAEQTKASSYEGVLLVRDDSSIADVADLQGQKVALVDRASTTGFLLPTAFLARSGVSAELVFAGSHEAAVAELLAGRVAAAATFEDGTRQGLRLLAITGELPNEPLFFHPRVPAATRSRIAQGLIAIAATNEGRALLAGAADITGFRPIADEHYDPVRQILAAAQSSLEDLVPGAWRLIDRHRLTPGQLGPL